MTEIIKVACHRIDGYVSKTSADLAAAIVKNAALEPLSLTSFFHQIMAEDGIQAELTPLYTQSEFIKDLKTSLLKGDLEVIQTLVSVAEDLTTMSQVTKDAIATVIVANSLRLVDVVADEREESRPETVTSAMIDTALGR